MSDDPRQPSHPDRDEGRSVDDFFAQERAQVRALATDDVRWRQIILAARARSRRWIRPALVAAAAVVVAAAVVWGLVGSPPQPGPSAPTGSSAVGTTTSRTGTPASTTPSQSASQTSSHAAGRPTGSGAPTTSSAPRPAVAVPVSFSVRSVSTADATHLFALGSVRCDTGTCPALAASADNGRSWRLVHTFTTQSVPAVARPGAPGEPGSLGDVRFANATTGWVFGGAVLRTTDGGVTWRTYPHPGGEVLSLETDGSEVVLTTAPLCSGGTCTGPITVVRAPVVAASATDAVGTINGGAGVTGAPIAWHAGLAYVSPLVTPSPGQTAPGPVIVRSDGLHPAGPGSCGNRAGAVQLVAPASGSTLFAICPSSGAAGHVGYEVAASSDGGTTWRVVSTDRLVLVDAGSVSAATADGSHLLAVSGGSPEVHGSMAVSGDGGATWAAPSAAPPLPTLGWAWVGAPGGSVFYALPGDGTGSYWKSIDDGATWGSVPVAGP
jgi:hypothetical protein